MVARPKVMFFERAFMTLSTTCSGSSVHQAKLVWQENNITEEVWNASCTIIRAEPSQLNARGELARQWKKQIAKIVSAKQPAPASGAEIDVDALPIEEDD
jgi:hypothetical protein